MMEFDFYVLAMDLVMLVKYAFWGMVSACFSFFLHYCFGLEAFSCVDGKVKGIAENVFYRYGELIAGIYCEHKIKSKDIEKGKKQNYIAWLMLPLGICIYCFNTWVSIFFWAGLGFNADALIPIVGISFVTICHLKARY